MRFRFWIFSPNNMEHVLLEMALVENASAPGRVQPIVGHRIQIIYALVTIQSSAAHMVYAKIPRMPLAYVSPLRVVRETQFWLTSVLVATVFNAALTVLSVAVRILPWVVAPIRVFQISISTLTFPWNSKTGWSCSLIGNSQRMTHAQAENAVKAAGISTVSNCSSRALAVLLLSLDVSSRHHNSYFFTLALFMNRYRRWSRQKGSWSIVSSEWILTRYQIGRVYK